MAVREGSHIGLWTALVAVLAVLSAALGAPAPATAGAASKDTPILVQTTHTIPGVPQGQTLGALVRAADDTLWTTAGTDIIRYAQDGTVTRFPAFPSGTASVVGQLQHYGTGFGYWVVAADASRHLMSVALDGTTAEIAWPSLAGRIRPGVESPDGSLWFPVVKSTQAGSSYLVRVAAGVATPFLLPVDAQRFLPTADGGAYFESFADGLFRLSPDGTVATVAGTENSYFWSMWVGTGGSIWLAGESQVGLIGSDGALQTLKNVSLSGIRAVTTEPQATTWLVGSQNGSAVALVGTTPADLATIPLSVPQDSPMTLAGGRLWVLQRPDPALASSPLFTVRSDGLKTPVGTSSDSGTDISTGPDGTVWVAEPSGVVAFRPDGSAHRGGQLLTGAAPHVFTSDNAPWLIQADGVITFRDAVSNRLSGSTRYDAAATIATTAFPSGASVVYLASGLNFPDALSAGPLAAADGGPLLLTLPGSLPSATRTAIATLAPSKVVVVGGPSSVSDAVLATLRTLVPEVQRIAGPDRYAVSRDIVASRQQAGKPLFVATGAGYADAVTAGAAAARAGGQLLLVPGDRATLPTGYASFIEGLSPSSIAVVGGSLSVSDGILAQLNGIATATRFGGDDRYAVAAAVVGAFGTPSAHVYLTTGANFPDALAAAPLAGQPGATLLSVPGSCVPAGTLSAIDAAHPSTVTVLGGTDSVGADVAWLARC